MLKIAAAGATALCAGILCTTPYSLSVTPQGSVSLSLDSAAARIGHPLTPMSVAGVHRRAMRRTYGVGANLGYHPVARAALYGAAATGAGYYGAGYGGWGGYGYGTGYGYPAYGYGYGGAIVTRLMAMAMALVTATRLTATAMAGALSAAVSMPPLGVIGAKTPDQKHRAGYLPKRLRCKLGATMPLQCPLWVKSGHQGQLNECPLSPRKRTSFGGGQRRSGIRPAPPSRR